MKKNGQYVGVDEKYIPEDEKYIDKTLNDEIRNDMENLYKGTKDYVLDKNNQEKIKKIGIKSLKTFKGIGITYLIFVCIIFIIIITTFIILFSQFLKNSKQNNEIKDKVIADINEQYK